MSFSLKDEPIDLVTMSDPMELFLRHLMAETNADNVTIEDDNASTEIPLPNLLLLHSSSSSEVSLSFSSLQNSASSLCSRMGSRSSRWDSMPNIGGDSNKEKRERVPTMPRRSLEKIPSANDIMSTCSKTKP